MPLNQRMDKENVAHLHIRVLFRRGEKKTNDVLNFPCQSMELENTILCEVTQTQEDEYGMSSLTVDTCYKQRILSL